MTFDANHRIYLTRWLNLKNSETIFHLNHGAGPVERRGDNKFVHKQKKDKKGTLLIELKTESFSHFRVLLAPGPNLCSEHIHTVCRSRASAHLQQSTINQCTKNMVITSPSTFTPHHIINQSQPLIQSTAQPPITTIQSSVNLNQDDQ